MRAELVPCELLWSFGACIKQLGHLLGRVHWESQVHHQMEKDGISASEQDSLGYLVRTSPGLHSTGNGVGLSGLYVPPSPQGLFWVPLLLVFTEQIYPCLCLGSPYLFQVETESSFCLEGAIISGDLCADFLSSKLPCRNPGDQSPVMQ